ncbi:MAG: Ig-like domain-containing protein [Chitinophagaceae bacterium]|nr:Ig-like domain-containing protein [Chitinophagaceae bacterium]
MFGSNDILNKIPTIKKLVYTLVLTFLLFFLFLGCSKGDSPVKVVDTSLSLKVNNNYNGTLIYTRLNVRPVVEFTFTETVDNGTVNSSIKLVGTSLADIPVTITITADGKQITVVPQNDLTSFTTYTLTVSNGLKSSTGGRLINPVTISLTTGITYTDKFPRITDDELLTKIQQQTFKYFWDFGHPVSGLARERNTSGETVTSGGSGFGIMAIPVGISRNFITRAEGFARMQKIVGFLKNTAVKVKGAFPHWLNGTTGAIIPFSANDNGADLVETSYLMMGLLTARQYFNGADPAEATLRSDINTLYNNVEWDWFRNGGQNVLYWHWSPDKGWAINLPIRGWNESLITYVMAASSTTHGIPASVYTNGWKTGSNFNNGNSYYGIQLPLGPVLGGPLFFEHYTFMGINPNGLVEGGINYLTQAKNHTLINYNYCKANPKAWYGYGDSCWGLTASDIEGGYTASSPNNDRGFIAPTAALSSFPFTPTESMQALKFFYYIIGDKIFKEYGFVDAFSLSNPWFASSFLVIDQGPIITMIENYRTGLVWNLFTSCPEVKAGMQGLGFSAPYL